MNRREVVLGMAAAAVAVPAAAQQGWISTGTTTQVDPFQPPQPPWPCKEERDAQYKICLLRGHVETIYGINNNVQQGGLGGMYVTMSSDRPATPYLAHSATDWRLCFYCKKRYRYVTNIEEKE